MGIVVIVSPRKFDIAGLLIRNGGNPAILESGFRKYSKLLNFSIRKPPKWKCHLWVRKEQRVRGVKETWVFEEYEPYNNYSEKNTAPRALVSEKNTAPRTKHRAWYPVKMKHRATYGHLARCLVRGAVFFSDTKAQGAVMRGWPDVTRRGVLFWHKGI